MLGSQIVIIMLRLIFFIISLALFLVLLIPLLLLLIVLRVLSLFGIGPKRNVFTYHTAWSNVMNRQREENTKRPENSESNRTFNKNDGEYVDFEEIK